MSNDLKLAVLAFGFIFVAAAVSIAVNLYIGFGFKREDSITSRSDRAELCRY